jgi:hypothetical protein
MSVSMNKVYDNPNRTNLNELVNMGYMIVKITKYIFALAI